MERPFDPEDTYQPPAPDPRRGDEHRDALADLRPVPSYQSRSISREEFLRAVYGPQGYLPCGKQTGEG